MSPLVLTAGVQRAQPFGRGLGVSPRVHYLFPLPIRKGARGMVLATFEAESSNEECREAAPHPTSQPPRLPADPQARYTALRRRGVAQSGSAPEWGSGGRWFESSRPDHPHYLPAAHLRLTAGTPPRSATPAASLPSPPATLAAARSAGRQGRLPVPHSRQPTR